MNRNNIHDNNNDDDDDQNKEGDGQLTRINV